MATKQERLLPDVKAEIRQSQAPASRLSTDGSMPTRALTDSIERLGVLQPVIVKPADKHGDYDVLAGNRRAEAAKSISHDMYVPIAVVVNAEELGADLPYVITLIENGMRSPNPLAEVDALHALFVGGASEAAIARETGLSVQTIRKRLRLERLHPTIKNAVLAGEVAIGVATDAAALPRGRQDELAGLILNRGAAGEKGARLTQADVDAAKRARATAAAAEIPAALFDVNTAGTSADHAGTVAIAAGYAADMGSDLAGVVTPDEAAGLSAEEVAVLPGLRATVAVALRAGVDVNALAKLLRREYRAAADGARR